MMDYKSAMLIVLHRSTIIDFPREIFVRLTSSFREKFTRGFSFHFVSIFPAAVAINLAETDLGFFPPKP